MTQVTRLDHRVILDILSTLDCARALTVAILFREHEFAQIVNLSFNPFDYNELTIARDSLQATELLRKHEDLPTGINLSAVARASFLAAELTCEESNQRISGSNSLAPQRFVASRKIMQCLGNFQAVDMFELAGWGPGVTLTLRGRDATPFNKFDKNAECTQPLLRFLKPLWDSQFPNWPLLAREYEGNRVITVPKNAKTDRTIAVEPSVNLFLQKGIGSMIRSSLASSGIDLNDQTRNQYLAKIGSKYGDLVTVDFSSASDTISYNCILDLFQCTDWFRVMDLLRSPRGYLHDEARLIEYNKFSSMGNGFTFELESLVFWALALACVPEDHPHFNHISVYGDDVIIPVDCYDDYIELCSFYGFTINKTKSFSSSYYRESCGSHFWNGVDITPVYIRRSLSLPREKMILHNRLVDLSIRCTGSGFRDKRFKSVISFLSSESEVRNPVPLGFGDSGLIKGFDECSPRFARKYQRGYYVKISFFKPKYEEKTSHAIRLVRLYDLWKRSQSGGISDTSLKNDVLIPRAGRYVVKTTWCPDWPSLGPWI